MSSRMEKAANNETEEHSSLSSGVYVSDANPTPPRHQNLLAAHDEASTDNVQRIAAHADHRTNSSSSDADAAFDSELTKEAATCTTDAGSGPRKCTPVTNVSSIEEDVKSAEHDSYSQESPHIPCTKMGAKVHTVVALEQAKVCTTSLADGGKPKVRRASLRAQSPPLKIHFNSQGDDNFPFLASIPISAPAAAYPNEIDLARNSTGVSSITCPFQKNHNFELFQGSMYPSLRQIDGSSVKADGTAEATVVKISAATTTEEKAKLANAASMPSPATSHGRKRCSAGRDRAGLAAQPTWEDYKLVTGHHPVLSEMLRTSRQDSRDHDVVRDLPELAKDDDVTDPLKLSKDTATFAPSRNNRAPEPPSTQAGAYSETPGQNAVRLEKTRVYRNMTPHNPTSVDILETDTPAEQASVHDDVDLEEGMSVSQRDREMYSQGSVTQEAADRDLLEAIPVADNDATVSQELGIATPMQSTEGERLELQKRHLLLRTSVTVFVMLLAVVGITLIILHSVLGREEENPTRAPEQDAANATESTTRLVKGLPDYSVEAILKDSTSPQARANQWLLNDPSLHNYTKNRIIQRFALATLFYSTNPPHLYEDLAPSLSMTSSWSQDRNWLSYDHHECEWFGRTQFHWYQQTIDLPVTIDKPCTDDGAYHALWLSDNNLIGSLPLEIFGLSTLNSIDVQRNPLLGGSIPSQIGLLSSLSLFSCANSSMTGTLPTELGLLTDAKQVALHVMFTKISGRLPSELGSVSNLERVMLGYNQITGSIPREIGTATAIHTLNLAGNRLSGSLPTELAQLSVLRYLWLQDNQISGSLATELGRLSSAWSITLQNNLLSGPLPSELGNLEKLFELRLRGNDLAGSIPESWTNLVGFNGSLQELDITDTLLTGRFEEEWCALNGGFVFDCVPSMLCGCGECQCSD